MTSSRLPFGPYPSASSQRNDFIEEGFKDIVINWKLIFGLTRLLDPKLGHKEISVVNSLCIVQCSVV